MNRRLRTLIPSSLMVTLMLGAGMAQAAEKVPTEAQDDAAVRLRS